MFEQLSLNYEKYANHDSNIEVGNIKNLYGDSTNIRVRPVNMNDILKVLTLGNEACCCTKLGGSKEQSSIPYLKYKMFSALEILDGNTPIGNTMCYFALVNNKLSFVLDNIEIKREYAFQDTIRDAVIKCARKFTNEVSNVQNLPIYICTQHNKVGDADLPLNFFDLKPLGCFEKEETYFDFLNSTVKHENFRTYKDIMLYDVTFIADERDKPKDMIIDSINHKWQLYITPNNNENINNNR